MHTCETKAMTSTRTEHTVKRDSHPRVVTLLDGWARRATLPLEKTVELVTDCDRFKRLSHSNGELAESDFEAFGKHCYKFLKTICGICYDRFLALDDKALYLIGTLLKGLGRTCFAFLMLDMGETTVSRNWS